MPRLTWRLRRDSLQDIQTSSPTVKSNMLLLLEGSVPCLAPLPLSRHFPSYCIALSKANPTTQSSNEFFLYMILDRLLLPPIPSGFIREGILFRGSNEIKTMRALCVQTLRVHYHYIHVRNHEMQQILNNIYIR